jgi:hypothetical protein
MESDDVIDADNTANQAFIRLTIFYTRGKSYGWRKRLYAFAVST